MSISSTGMDQHFFGGPVGRCISRNIRTFVSGLEVGVAEVMYEVSGAPRVPACGPESEVVEGGLGACPWGLEVVVGGFEWDPNAIEGVMGDTKLCPSVRDDELTGGHLFLSGNLDMLVVSGASLAGRLFLSGSPEKLIRSSSSLAGLFDGLADDADALVLTCMLSVGT
jgi:hypothetical protein